MRFSIAIGAFSFVTLFAAGASGAPILQAANTCNYSGANCLFFNQAGVAFTARSFDFNAPGAGKALVSVTGSGVCTNSAGSVSVADFETQIVNDPAALPAYSNPGGNRFRFTLFASPNPLSGNGVFNLASQRLFNVRKAGLQHFALNMIGDRIDSNVE